MSEIDVLAEKAELIVNGYAIIPFDENYTVINLNKKNHTTVFAPSGEVIESSMDDIEIVIARNYLLNNLSFLEQ